MAIDKLGIYNNALIQVGETKLTLITDDVDSRHALDAVYDLGAIDYCLELVKPRFATRTIESTGSATTGASSLAYEHALPADYLNLVGVFLDQDLDQKSSRYIIEEGKLYTDDQVAYIRYVTNDGITETDFTPTFARVVATYLAREISYKFDPDRYNDIDARLEKEVALAVANEGAKESDPLSTKTSSHTLDKLGIYNAALIQIGQPKLTALTDDVETRRDLDIVYGLGAIDYCLEAVKPRFATRTVALTGITSTGASSLAKEFSLPADYICNVGYFSDQELDEPLHRFIEEEGKVYADYATIYLRYVTNDGITETNFTPAFARVMATYLARELAHKYQPEKYEFIDQNLQNLVDVAVGVERDKERERRPAKEGSTLSASWYKIYNGALQILGKSKLTTTTSDHPYRVAMDTAVNSEIVEALMEDTNWKFGLESTKITYNPAVTPSFGYSYAHDKPADLHRIVGLYTDEFFKERLTNYVDEGAYFLAPYQEIYLVYVDSDWIDTPENWPTYFSRMVMAYLAREVAPEIAPEKFEDADTEYEKRKNMAFGNEAAQRPPGMIASGNWVKTRYTQNSGRGRP